MNATVKWFPTGKFQIASITFPANETIGGAIETIAHRNNDEIDAYLLNMTLYDTKMHEDYSCNYCKQSHTNCDCILF